MPRYVYKTRTIGQSGRRIVAPGVWLVAALMVIGLAGGGLLGRAIVTNTIVIGFGEAPLPAVTPPAEAAWTAAPTQVDQQVLAETMPRVAAAPRAGRAATGSFDPTRAELHLFPARPRLLDSATFVDANGAVLKVAGVDGMSFTQVCVAPDGARWACGSRARTALNRLLADQALACEPRGETIAGVRPVECDVAGVDMSVWLVRQGFARVSAAAVPAPVGAPAR